MLFNYVDDLTSFHWYYLYDSGWKLSCIALLQLWEYMTAEEKRKSLPNINGYNQQNTLPQWYKSHFTIHLQQIEASKYCAKWNSRLKKLERESNNCRTESLCSEQFPWRCLVLEFYKWEITRSVKLVIAQAIFQMGRTC